MHITLSKLILPDLDLDTGYCGDVGATSFLSFLYKLVNDTSHLVYDIFFAKVLSSTQSLGFPMQIPRHLKKKLMLRKIIYFILFFFFFIYLLLFFTATCSLLNNLISKVVTPST